MKQSTKTILIVLLLILVPVAGGIGYWLYTKKKNQESDQEHPADESAGTVTPGASSTTTTTKEDKTTNSQFPLTFNEHVKSALVKECQEIINDQIADCIPPSCPYYNGQQIKSLVVDGYYGKKTAAAVKYLFPASDGKSITESMYNQLIGKREKGSYLLF